MVGCAEMNLSNDRFILKKHHENIYLMIVFHKFKLILHP